MEWRTLVSSISKKSIIDMEIEGVVSVSEKLEKLITGSTRQQVDCNKRKLLLYVFNFLLDRRAWRSWIR